MENVRNRIDFQIVTNEKDLLKLTSKPRFTNKTEFSESVVGVNLQKTKVMLNKPVMVGFCILELSKVSMYDFHYNTILKKYGAKKAKFVFTDTDSLCYEIQTEDVYKDIEEIKDQFDFSEYPEDHFLHNTDNKKVIGKFKCETNGNPITEFVGLKSKMYSFTTENKNVKKAKGVKTNVIKQDITHEDYKDCLFNDTTVKLYKMNTIRSYAHEIYSIELNKISLSSLDKRFYLNNLDSRSYGHYMNETQF